MWTTDPPTTRSPLHQAKVACPSVLAERRLLEEVNGFGEAMRFCEDYELWLRLSRQASVRAVPIPLVSVRSHAGSGTQQHRYTGWEYFVRTYDILRPARRGVRWFE